MAQSYFSEREVRLARSFIKAIGGNQTNGYLLLAVIAWQRAMTKSHETFWKSLSKYTPVRAGQLLANRLARKATLLPGQYKGLFQALRRSAKTQSGQVMQARDFMLIIQKSNWNKDHYGYKPYKAGYWLTRELPNGKTETIWVAEQQEYDPLAIIWSKLTGHNIPKAYFVDGTTTSTPVQPKAPKPRPQQPRSLLHVQPEPNYLQPYAARHFYEARAHLGNNVLRDV